MPAPKKFDPTQVQIASVLASQGLTQERIAEILGVSQSGVSRALREARSNGWLVDVLQCPLPARRRMELVQMAYQDDLLKALQQEQVTGRRHLRELWIFDVGEDLARRHGRGALHRRLAVFGRAVARHLGETVLPGLRSVGISWGLTLRHVMNGLDPGFRGLRAEDPILCFPVSGDPPEAVSDHLRAASTLTAFFDECINGGSDRIVNFTRVCAAIPAGFSKAELEVLYRYFRLEPGYVRVFGDGSRPGLIHDAHALWTSAGSFRLKQDPWVQGSAAAAGIDPMVLVSHTYGNLGGTFLPRPDIPKRAAECIAKVNRLWTGIRPEHFLACAERAARSRSRPGVILIVSGRKAEIVLEAVRQGLVSILIVDQALARDLGELVS